MKKILILLSFFIALGNFTMAQTAITGGAGVTQVDGNPNLNTLLATSATDEAKIAIDVTGNKAYWYDNSRTAGSKWQEIKTNGDGFPSNMTIAGNVITLTRTNADGTTTPFTVTLPTSAAADGSETKVTAGTNVTMTGTGTTVSPYVVSATVPDNSATNELQTISTTSNTVTLSNSGGSVTIAGAGGNTVSTTGSTITVTAPTVIDGSATNEIQTLSIAGQTVSLSLGGGSVNIPSADGSATKLNAGTNTTVTGGGTTASPYVVNASFTEVDGSTTNEIQTLGSSVVSGAFNITLSSSASATILPAAFYIDDAAAATGGVAIGAPYKVDTGNSYGKSKGDTRVRVN